jgi:CubicO group peptidase (beta-lactamase class C family)
MLPFALALALQAPLTAAAAESLADRHFGAAPSAGAAAIITVVKDGQVILTKGYGYANRATRSPVDPAATLFRIGSTTKLFTAIAALQLIDAGVVDPDADVNRYLEKLGIKLHDRYAEPVTMRALLALQAGRFDWTYSYYYPIHDDRETRLPADEVGRRFWRTDRPGDVSAYDNNGVGLIGLVAEAAAGKPYRELIRSAIFEPLEMTRSVAGVPRDRVPEMAGCADPNLATAYQHCPYDLISQNLRGSGDITITAADMGRFLLALLDQGRLGDAAVLSPESWADFTNFDRHEIDPRLPAWGEVIYEAFTGGRYAFGHDGGVGQFGSVLRIYPRSNVGVFVAVQRGLDWESPSFIPKRLSELRASPRPAAPSPDQTRFLTGWGGFEADFATTFIPPSAPPGSERLAAIAPIPASALGGRYWIQLAKGKRSLLLRMLERLEPTLAVTPLGDDRLRIRLPTGAPAGIYRRSGVNAYTDSTTRATIVFAASARGINANSTTGAAPWFYRQLPWHYRPAVTLYPLFVAFIVLVSAFAYWLVSRRRPADVGVASALSLGVAAVVFGWWSELELVMPVWYHGGHVLAAIAWRTVLHLGLASLGLGVILIVLRWPVLLAPTTGPARAVKAAYLGLMAMAAIVTIVLTGYWGLIGTFGG